VLKKILIGAGVTIGAGLIIAATGWNFLATANMSDKFVSKTDFNLTFKGFSECNEKDHDRIKNKLDKIYDLLMQHYIERTASNNAWAEEAVDADNFRE